MNWLVTLTCLAAIVAEACGALCRTEGECGTEQCCVFLSPAQMTGRGICRNLVRAGRQCNEPEAKVDYYGGKYSRYCPCQEGLSCMPRNLRPGNTDRARYLASLRCQVAPETTTQAEIVEEITTQAEIVEEITTQEEIVEEITTQEEIVEEITTQEEIVEEEVIIEEQPAGAEGNLDEEIDDASTSDEETGDEETEEEETEEEETEEEFPEEIAGGPGGEPPRDDDCENWEYPC